MTRNREIVLIFIVVLVGLACTASLTHGLGMKVSDAAAWAQAIGTVGAILATIAMTNRQIDALRREKQGERDDLVRAMGEAFGAMLDCLTKIEVAVQSRDDMEIAGAIYGQPKHRDATVDKFLEMPIERWPSATLYMRALELTAARDALVGSASDVLRNGPGPRQAALWDIAAAQHKELSRVRERFWAAHRALMRE